MLNVCFSDRDAESKKDILTKSFGMVVDDGLGKEVVDMCNLSEAVYERGILKGKIEGKMEGKMEKAKDTALKLVDRGMSISDVASILEVSESQVERWAAEAISLV